MERFKFLFESNSLILFKSTDRFLLDFISFLHLEGTIEYIISYFYGCHTVPKISYEKNKIKLVMKQSTQILTNVSYCNMPYLWSKRFF